MWKETSRTSNMDYGQNVVPEDFLDWKRGDVVVLKTLSDLEPGKELFDAYGYSYINLQRLSVCQELES